MKKINKNIISFIFFIIIVLNVIFHMYFILIPIIILSIFLFIIYIINKNNKLLKSLKDKVFNHYLVEENIDEDSENTEDDNIDMNEHSILISSINNSTPILRLERRKKYLQIALNNSIEEAESIINLLPSTDRIIIEVGTPMIKRYGIKAIERIKSMLPAGTYIVADNKCADLASREVEMMAKAGANASTCLGIAPVETIDSFIAECKKYEIDSMLDMMNVEDSLSVLKKLKLLPSVVMLHRGVDETEKNHSKQIPLYQIKQIKGNFKVMVSVAGGDSIKEIQSSFFNDADIVVVWKNFYQSSTNTNELAKSFLREIK
jgi:3-keto-L-gulonate-6-phosphate decarboxylase